MQVNKLLIRKLYGFMNKDIIFHSRISILVGINGSGKTSVLNLLNWLLTLNIEELCLIEFESITLYFKFQEYDYELVCKQREAEIVFDLKNTTEGKAFHQIQATFEQHPIKLTKNKSLKDSLRGKYQRLSPEEHEIETWAFIKNILPSPMVIGLDRNLYTQEGNEVRIQEDFIANDRKSYRERPSNSTPIDRVKSELINNFNLYRKNLVKSSF